MWPNGPRLARSPREDVETSPSIADTRDHTASAYASQPTQTSRGAPNGNLSCIRQQSQRPMMGPVDIFMCAFPRLIVPRLVEAFAVVGAERSSHRYPRAAAAPVIVPSAFSEPVTCVHPTEVVHVAAFAAHPSTTFVEPQQTQRHRFVARICPLAPGHCPGCTRATAAQSDHKPNRFHVAPLGANPNSSANAWLALSGAGTRLAIDYAASLHLYDEDHKHEPAFCVTENRSVSGPALFLAGPRSRAWGYMSGGDGPAIRTLSLATTSRAVSV